MAPSKRAPTKKAPVKTQAKKTANLIQPHVHVVTMYFAHRLAIPAIPVIPQIPVVPVRYPWKHREFTDPWLRVRVFPDTGTGSRKIPADYPCQSLRTLRSIPIFRL